MVFRRLAMHAAAFLCSPPAISFDFVGVSGFPSQDLQVVEDLTDSDFGNFVKEHEVSAVLFYEPSSEYSQQMLPQWDTAAEKLMLRDPPVQLAKIDANKNNVASDQYEVMDLPTAKLFANGMVFTYDHKDGPGWQAVVKWISQHLDREHVLNSTDEVDHFLNNHDLSVIGLFPDGEIHPTFLKSARHLPNVMFAEVRGSTIAKEVAEHISAHGSWTCETITVGGSETNSKLTELPREHMHCHNTPVNPQQPEWKDKYEASVEGKNLEVKRVDQSRGWEQRLRIRCCDDEPFADKRQIPVPSVVMFMPHDERFAIYDGDLNDLHALDRWAMARSRPMVVQFTRSSLDALTEPGPENIPSLLLISSSTEDALEAVLRRASKSLRGRAFIYLCGRSSELERRLADMAGVHAEDTEPVVTILNMFPADGHGPQEADLSQQQSSVGTVRKYRIGTSGLTEDRLIQWVTDYEQGRLKPWLTSEPEPTAAELSDSDGILGSLVGTTYVACAQNEDRDVLIDFYAAWCGHCHKLMPTLRAVALNLKHVETLDIKKIDAGRNEIADVALRSFPELFLFPAGKRPKTAVRFGGNLTVSAITEWLQEHVTHKFDPSHLPAEAADVDPMESRLLSPSEEDL